MTLIERAERAVIDTIFPVEEESGWTIDNPREVVRAMLWAIRDVDTGSPAIVAAGKSALYSCSEDPELQDARGCWQAMIDAALAE